MTRDAIIERYNHATDTSVLTAYGRPSARKVAIEQKILDEMKNVDGYGYCVTGHNSSHFTCAYKYKDANGDERIVYHTYANKYEVII